MTVEELIKSVRYRVRDTDKTNYTDEEILTYLNELLNGCYVTMQNVESILIMDEGEIPIVKDTECYDITFQHNGFLDEGLWIVGNVNPLLRTTKVELGPSKNAIEVHSSYPLRYYLDGDQICLHPIPKQDGTLKISYWMPFAELTLTDEIPWGGFWDRYLVKATVIDCLERQERDVSQMAVMVVGLFDDAIAEVMKQGVRERRVRSDMFTARGC
jgi:hypothetical protein